MTSSSAADGSKRTQTSSLCDVRFFLHLNIKELADGEGHRGAYFRTPVFSKSILGHWMYRGCRGQSSEMRRLWMMKMTSMTRKRGKNWMKRSKRSRSLT